MTDEELQEAKRKLPCEYLRYYGKPRGLLTVEEMDRIWYWKSAERKHEEKEIKKKLREFEYPELNEKEMLDFVYLRACLYTGVKPIGDFEGDAKICAEVMNNMGNIVDMCRAGADPIYCACLSAHGLDIKTQREIIDAHVPF